VFIFRPWHDILTQRADLIHLQLIIKQKRFMLKLRIHPLILSLSTILLFFACTVETKRSNPQAGVVVRDTSITSETAFINFFLDSATVTGYLDSAEVSPEDSAAISNFYQDRNYQYAWFDTSGLTEHASSFVSLYRDYRTANKDSGLKSRALDKTIDDIMEDSAYIHDNKKIIVPTELALTVQFFRYAEKAYAGDPTLDLKAMGWFIPRKKLNITAFLDSVVRGGKNDFSQYEPVNPMFTPLRKALLKYSELSQTGEWASIPMDAKSYKLGDSSAVIGAIKKRLQLLGDLPATDTGNVFTRETRIGVGNFQHRFGMVEDSIIGKAMMAEMNVPPTERVKQLAVNVERIKWVPKPGTGRYLVANIPSFMLYAYDSGKLQFTMKIVVGKAASSSVIFSDEMEIIAFSPYWNVPYSIVKNEMAGKPASYFARQNMEIVGKYGDGLPQVRQKPGGQNSLGKVKFLFPNSYAIYFHDTPAKGLFESNKRAFSHGCIRLEQPEKLANWLLAGNPNYPPEKIKELMNQDTEKQVKLDKKVPVFIGYFTAWVDKDGKLNFRDDIYGHDAKMKERMFGKQ
jgi:murein L,D-transpeptidase YcbB/YkuD